MKKINVVFGEKVKVLRFNECGGIDVDPDSAIISERADQIAREDGISFGEALKRARHETLRGSESRKRGFDDRWVEITYSDGSKVIKTT